MLSCTLLRETRRAQTSVALFAPGWTHENFDARVAPRVRRLCRAAEGQLTVMTNAEVVCVDGVHGVEAVVVRYTRTGRLCAVNASASMVAPSRMSIARRVLPSRLALKRCDGSGIAAPRAKVSFTTFA